jgi:hypothetical protein
MNLRPYQHQLITDIRLQYQLGKRSVLAVLPTGGGKWYDLLTTACRAMPTVCKIEGCDKPCDCHGMCGMHAQRMRRYGDPYYVTPEQERRANNRAAQIARLDSVKPSTYRKRHGRHEHRVVAEQMLGRALMPGEIVHHIDGDKHNNNPSNLQVMTQDHHLREHLAPDAAPIEWQGRSMYPKDWAQEFGISVQRFYGRRRAGWSMDRIAATPTRKWNKANA